MKTTSRSRSVLATGGAVALLAVAGLSTAGAKPCADNAGDQCQPPPSPPQVHAVGTVDVAAGWTLGVRRVPRQNAKQYRRLRDGGKALIVCQRHGSRVSGTFGTTRLWNRLKKGGYVSDAYVYTGSDGRVAPKC